ncbi:MAG: sialidase family protein [Planctomycetaceae bacterium]
MSARSPYTHSLDRRNVLRTMCASAAGAVAWTGLHLSAQAGTANKSLAVPKFELLDLKTFSLPDDRYYGWPTVARQKNGRLLVVASGGRERHVCPFGRVDLIQSDDSGDTWSFARTIADGPIDDRDAGIIETSHGTLLATTFTSLAYLPTLQKAIESAGTDKPLMKPEQLARWQAAHRRLPEGQHKEHTACWLLRSEDNGLSWSSPYRCPVNSPHGPINLSDGTLLYAGKMLWEEPNKVGVCRSEDDGRTWKWLADIPTRPGDDHKNYHELHAVEASDGRLVVHIRNHNKTNAGETLQCHSTDGGLTWSMPASIGVWGMPSHLMKLKDGRLLMSYGHRRKPLGNQIRLSSDNGESWSEAIVLYGDGATGDLGYPSTVEFDDGRLLTVWYELMPETGMSQLRAARWKLVD